MNPIYTHPGQYEMQAEVVLASKGPDQKPIYTIRLRYPRIIHGEVMTHRVFSRNARSSRAVPVKTMLNEVRNMPFIPWHWGKNQGGMQADEECNEPVLVTNWLDIDFNGNPAKEKVVREEAWISAAECAAGHAQAYMEAGYHKQIPNRLLEPFSWIDTLITSTEWDNFLWLRDHRDAEPHFQDLARLVKLAIENATVLPIEPGEWHMPYIDEEDRHKVEHEYNDGRTPASVMLCKISAARCARISYKPFDGDSSYERELERYDSLVTADRVHASPLEHQATPDQAVLISADVFESENKSLSPDGFLEARQGYLHEGFHGNLTGYIQYRKTIPNEEKMEDVL